MSEDYVSRFAKLSTDRNRTFCTTRGTFHAPHKPLVLLSVLDLVAEGAIESNLIESND
jgi:putative restriction endonuclease